jgi:hypothetical protein
MTGTAIIVLGTYQENLDFFPSIITSLEIILQNIYQYDDNHSPKNEKIPSPWYAVHIKYDSENIQHNE